VAYIIRKLQSYGVSVGSTDQYADTQKAMHEYPFEMNPKPKDTYDAFIIAVAHHGYRAMKEHNFLTFANKLNLLVDVKGLYIN
jgi:UDP-N-acetyl-D-mannosaminuronate dehydrogenase